MSSIFLTQHELLKIKNSLLDFVVNVAEMPTASQHRIAILPQMTELLLKFTDPNIVLNLLEAQS